MFRLCTISNVNKPSSQDAGRGDQGTSSAHSPSRGSGGRDEGPLQAVKESSQGFGDAQAPRDPPHGSRSPLA